MNYILVLIICIDYLLLNFENQNKTKIINLITFRKKSVQCFDGEIIN